MKKTFLILSSLILSVSALLTINLTHKNNIFTQEYSLSETYNSRRNSLSRSNFTSSQEESMTIDFSSDSQPSTIAMPIASNIEEEQLKKVYITIGLVIIFMAIGITIGSHLIYVLLLKEG